VKLFHEILVYFLQLTTMLSNIKFMFCAEPVSRTSEKRAGRANEIASQV
jgi:hypothetical protein